MLVHFLSVEVTPNQCSILKRFRDDGVLNRDGVLNVIVYSERSIFVALRVVRRSEFREGERVQPNPAPGSQSTI